MQVKGIRIFAPSSDQYLPITLRDFLSFPLCIQFDKEVKVQNYLIFHPSYPGWIWAEVNKDGETDNKILSSIISKIPESVYSKKGSQLRMLSPS